jgi:hypothetical protein
MGAASITDSGRSAATLTPRPATITASAVPIEHNEPRRATHTNGGETAGVS